MKHAQLKMGLAAALLAVSGTGFAGSTGVTTLNGTVSASNEMKTGGSVTVADVMASLEGKEISCQVENVWIRTTFFGVDPGIQRAKVMGGKFYTKSTIRQRAWNNTWFTFYSDWREGDTSLRGNTSTGNPDAFPEYNLHVTADIGGLRVKNISPVMNMTSTALTGVMGSTLCSATW